MKKKEIIYFNHFYLIGEEKLRFNENIKYFTQIYLPQLGPERDDDEKKNRKHHSRFLNKRKYFTLDFKTIKKLMIIKSSGSRVVEKQQQRNIHNNKKTKMNKFLFEMFSSLSFDRSATTAASAPCIYEKWE